MPVRTSSVVAIGLGLLTVIGVGTVFGDSIVALVARPTIPTASDTASDTAATAAARTKAPVPTLPDAARADAGTGVSSQKSLDGSS